MSMEAAHDILELLCPSSAASSLRRDVLLIYFGTTRRNNRKLVSRLKMIRLKFLTYVSAQEFHLK